MVTCQTSSAAGKNGGNAVVLARKLDDAEGDALDCLNRRPVAGTAGDLQPLADGICQICQMEGWQHTGNRISHVD